MLNDLRIPKEDQDKLADAGIKDYKTLKASQSDLDRRLLSGVSYAAQRIISSASFHLDSSEHEDPLSKFTKQGWMMFAVACESSNQPLASGANATRISLKSEMLEKDVANTKKKDSHGMEIDGEDDNENMDCSGDDFGGTPRNEDADEEVGHSANIQSEKEDSEAKKHSKFAMMRQGFETKGLVDADTENDEENLPFVDVNGSRYYRDRCYHFNNTKERGGNSSEPIIVGFKKIKRDPTTKCITLLCVAVIHIKETFLGHEDNGEFCRAVSNNYPSLFVQIRGEEALDPSDLGSCSSNPSNVPNLIYEPRTIGQKQQFAYLRDNDGNNILRMKRTGLTLIEGSAGAGGESHNCFDLFLFFIHHVSLFAFVCHCCVSRWNPFGTQGGRFHSSSCH